MTPEEKSVMGGWNQQAVTNTEARLMCVLGLPSKKEFMDDMGADIIYHGPSGIWPEK
jgi:hypothetical protein